ncbi:MAG: ABC transporter permease [Clostridia bacterium]|nr:ABC transporter permease [Clostridia bacterium]
MKKDQTKNTEKNENYSLNDDRRVKMLSPGALVAKRFFRNRLAVTGLIILAFMFSFSYIGGIISPYEEDQKFYRVEAQLKDYAGAIRNTEFRYTTADASVFSSAAQAKAFLAISGGESSYVYRDVTYELEELSPELYIIRVGGEIVGIASKYIVSSSTSNEDFPFEFTLNSLEAYLDGSGFEAEGKIYEIDEDGVVTESGTEVAYISDYIVRAVAGDVFLTREFKTKLIETIESGSTEFVYTDEKGETYEYKLTFNNANSSWNIKRETDRTVYDNYAFPTKEHWLGLDGNGMDMLTRLMYGGRVSLRIGFIVVFIETFLGVIMGGISGYFGGWVDMLIMRIVDVFYCIPSLPIFVILGAAMSAANLDSEIRMLFLMLIIGFLGWPGVARLVRGQILSLREQEFMTATEATGISVSRRIFRHLVPNVIPQLIVTCTMGLGDTILTEATLSFLGIGVSFPYASWGNIISDVTNLETLTHYLHVWIPAGILLLLTVLAFNIVGDGLRDAFDPKMKR